MGCFLGCFGGAKDRSRQQAGVAADRRASPRRDFVGAKLLATVDEFEKPLRWSNSQIKPLAEEDDQGGSGFSGREIEKPLLRSLLAMKHAGEEAAAESHFEFKRENNEHGSSASSCPKKPFRRSISPGKPAGEESTTERKNQQQGSSGSNGRARKKVTFNLNVQTIVVVSASNELNFIEEEEEEVKFKDAENKSNPVNCRYQNCMDGEDEEIDEDEDGIGELLEDEEESYESYFSLPLDKENEISSEEVNSSNLCKTPTIPASQAAHHTARDRSQFVNSVLNPIENLSQWREIKTAKTKTEENHTKNSEKQELAVDASLSSWLSTPPAKSGSQKSTSPCSKEDQPILGPLTVDDLKQSSVTSSPRRSASRSTDEVPIIGTVGSYLRSRNEEVCDSCSSWPGTEVKGIPNNTTKCREDKRVNNETTPFELILERGLSNNETTSSFYLLSGFRV